MAEVAVADLETLVAAAERGYVERNPESRRLHEARTKVMPGGNTRTIIHVEPFPLTIVRGEGATLTDADGHEYVDFLGEYTAGLFGHSHAVVMQALPVGRAGAFLQLGHRGEPARDVAGARRDREARDHGLRGRLPRGRLLLPDGRGLADQRAVPLRRGAVQRRRGRCPPDRRARGRARGR